MHASETDIRLMIRALELAKQGQGYVEPNPMVGCVIACGDEVIGEGWHQGFGGPHAEIEAIRHARSVPKDTTLYVTLEPCCHFGKTPPCTEAVVKTGVRRVVIAQRDPFPQVDGGGIEQLKQHGIKVEVGLLEEQAKELNAPYLKLTKTGRPWLIAKWAMSLDGKLATRTGDSQWISNEPSRAIVHHLRGRMDAIIVGRTTAQLDDPQLTARPPGCRTPTRIVLDSLASISPSSKLVCTATEIPVVVVVLPDAPTEKCSQLRAAGCEVLALQVDNPQDRLEKLFDELGRRQMTNVLVEGGGELLGSIFAMNAIDEVHVFIAPIIIGGNEASTIRGIGVEKIADSLALQNTQCRQLDDNLYLSGRLNQD